MKQQEFKNMTVEVGGQTVKLETLESKAISEKLELDNKSKGSAASTSPASTKRTVPNKGLPALPGDAPATAPPAASAAPASAKRTVPNKGLPALPGNAAAAAPPAAPAAPASAKRTVPNKGLPALPGNAPAATSPASTSDLKNLTSNDKNIQGKGDIKNAKLNAKIFNEHLNVENKVRGSNFKIAAESKLKNAGNFVKDGVGGIGEGIGKKVEPLNNGLKEGANRFNRGKNYLGSLINENTAAAKNKLKDLSTASGKLANKITDPIEGKISSFDDRSKYKDFKSQAKSDNKIAIKNAEDTYQDKFKELNSGKSKELETIESDYKKDNDATKRKSKIDDVENKYKDKLKALNKENVDQRRSLAQDLDSKKTEFKKQTQELNELKKADVDIRKEGAAIAREDNRLQDVKNKLDRIENEWKLNHEESWSKEEKKLQKQENDALKNYDDEKAKLDKEYDSKIKKLTAEKNIKDESKSKVIALEKEKAQRDLDKKRSIIRNNEIKAQNNLKKMPDGPEKLKKEAELSSKYQSERSTAEAEFNREHERINKKYDTTSLEDKIKGNQLKKAEKLESLAKERDGALEKVAKERWKNREKFVNDRDADIEKRKTTIKDKKTGEDKFKNYENDKSKLDASKTSFDDKKNKFSDDMKSWTEKRQALTGEKSGSVASSKSNSTAAPGGSASTDATKSSAPKPPEAPKPTSAGGTLKSGTTSTAASADSTPPKSSGSKYSYSDYLQEELKQKKASIGAEYSKDILDSEKDPLKKANLIAERDAKIKLAEDQMERKTKAVDDYNAYKAKGKPIEQKLNADYASGKQRIKDQYDDLIKNEADEEIRKKLEAKRSNAKTALKDDQKRLKGYLETKSSAPGYKERVLDEEYKKKMSEIEEKYQDKLKTSPSVKERVKIEEKKKLSELKAKETLDRKSSAVEDYKKGIGSTEKFKTDYNNEKIRTGKEYDDKIAAESDDVKKNKLLEEKKERLSSLKSARDEKIQAIDDYKNRERYSKRVGSDYDETINSVKKEYDDKIKANNDKIASLKETQKKEFDKVLKDRADGKFNDPSGKVDDKEFKAAMDKAVEEKDSKKDEIKSLQKENRDLEKQKSKAVSGLDATKKEHLDTLEDGKKSKFSGFKEELAKDYQTKQAEIKSEYKQAKNDLKTAHATEIDAQKQKFQAELSSKDPTKLDEIKELEKTQETEKAKLQAKQSDELQKLKSNRVQSENEEFNRMREKANDIEEYKNNKASFKDGEASKASSSSVDSKVGDSTPEGDSKSPISKDKAEEAKNDKDRSSCMAAVAFAMQVGIRTYSLVEAVKTRDHAKDEIKKLVSQAQAATVVAGASTVPTSETSGVPQDGATETGSPEIFGSSSSLSSSSALNDAVNTAMNCSAEACGAITSSATAGEQAMMAAVGGPGVLLSQVPDLGSFVSQSINGSPSAALAGVLSPSLGDAGAWVAGIADSAKDEAKMIAPILNRGAPLSQEARASLAAISKQTQVKSVSPESKNSFFGFSLPWGNSESNHQLTGRSEIQSSISGPDIWHKNTEMNLFQIVSDRIGKSSSRVLSGNGGGYR
jgi:hypothetical protein